MQCRYKNTLDNTVHHYNHNHMDPILMKAAFFWAIVSRVHRQYVKSKNEELVETNLPEGIKFMLTYVFIYMFSLFLIGFFDGTAILIQKIL